MEAGETLDEGLELRVLGYIGIDNLMEQDYLLGALGIGVALAWLVLLVLEWRGK